MADREHSTHKGISVGGLVTGIVGSATGIPALVAAITSLMREGKTSQAESMAIANGLSLADILAFTNGGGYGPHGGHGCFEAAPATHYDLDAASKLAEKDAVIAQLKADGRTDDKLVAVNSHLSGKIEEMSKAMVDSAVRAARAEGKAEAEFETLKATVAAHGKEISRMSTELSHQATHNAVVGERLGCIGTQVQQLQGAFSGMTETVVPQSHILPTQPLAVHPIQPMAPETPLQTTMATISSTLTSLLTAVEDLD